MDKDFIYNFYNYIYFEHSDKIYYAKVVNTMGDKQVTKIRLSTFLLIIAIIIITIIGFFIYKLNSEKSIKAKKSVDSQEQVSNLQSKMNTNSEKVNSSTTTNTSESDDIKYEISKKKNQYGDEVIAAIKATKEGKTTTKEFEMDALITDTGTMKLPTIGSVALVAETGGEYFGVSVYQLVNGEIKKLGTIDCSADMVKEATYSVENKGKSTVVITANRNGEITKKEIEMSATIDKAEVIDVLGCGKVVLVAETRGEYYEFKVFRLSEDYTNGKTQGIVEAGTLKYSL
mgnify:CR=1 FL=1